MRCELEIETCLDLSVPSDGGNIPINLIQQDCAITVAYDLGRDGVEDFWFTAFRIEEPLEPYNFATVTAENQPKYFALLNWIAERSSKVKEHFYEAIGTEHGLRVANGPQMERAM